MTTKCAVRKPHERDNVAIQRNSKGPGQSNKGWTLTMKFTDSLNVDAAIQKEEAKCSYLLRQSRVRWEFTTNHMREIMWPFRGIQIGPDSQTRGGH